MSWQPYPSTFEKARRKEAYRRLGNIVKRVRSPELLPLEEVSTRLRLFEQTYVGIRPIPVDRIVGTAGRSRDFDRDFLPRNPDIAARWKNVERAFPQADFPPIVVYQLDESYFVVDGHHRVAIAKRRGMKTIDAEITKLKTRFTVPAGLDIGEVILAEQQRIFMEESGLDRARPEAVIEFSRAPGYVELLELVKVHGFHLIQEQGQLLSGEEIAGDWYDRVYLPTVETMRRERLAEAFRDATEADLFLWVYQRRRGLFPERGLTLEEAVREASEEGRRLTARTRRTVGRIKRPQRTRKS